MNSEKEIANRLKGNLFFTFKVLVNKFEESFTNLVVVGSFIELGKQREIMLEKINLKKAMDKDAYEAYINRICSRLSLLQRQCREAQIPIIIVFEGWDGAGKGVLINKLITPLDPRGFKVYTTENTSSEERLHPYLWKFWTKLPAKGRIHIFDRSWYQKVLYETKLKNKETQLMYEELVNFEQLLSEDGTVIIKFFLHIGKKEQEKRLKRMEKNTATAWRVTKQDWKRHKEYDRYIKRYDEMLANTDTGVAPWTIVEATDRRYAAAKIIHTVVDRLEIELVKKKQIQVSKEQKEIPKDREDSFETGVLEGVDLSKCYTKEEYRKLLSFYQRRLAVLHNQMYRLRIPVILAFEGWDAAGKGGAIKRVTQKLDPRGYEVVPISAPNDIERSHHYLWRFWNHMPKAGHMAIFDRTWYGRVLVERVEKFAKKEEWERAYNEINQMEEYLSDEGCIVLKFWLHIDKDEQERRFQARQQTPEKQWKITEEDWRNREKWEEYVKAVDEMIVRTSTENAPWIIVEANSKLYARVKVLKIVVEAIEKQIKEKK